MDEKIHAIAKKQAAVAKQTDSANTAALMEALKIENSGAEEKLKYQEENSLWIGVAGYILEAMVPNFEEAYKLMAAQVGDGDVSMTKRIILAATLRKVFGE